MGENLEEHCQSNKILAQANFFNQKRQFQQGGRKYRPPLFDLTGILQQFSVAHP